MNVGTYTGRPWEVLAGNHTLMAFRELAETDPSTWKRILVHWVDVDDDMCNRITVADNRLSELGGMDEELLADLLNDIGENIEGLGFSEQEIADICSLVDGGGGGDSDGLDYSTKVDVPQYTPSDDPPPVTELADTGKTAEIEKAIFAAELPDDVRDFLLRAAQRHTVIDFHKVADYYASATPEVQRLMEQQALVIIDYEDAIKNGYSKMSREMEMLMALDTDALAAEEGAA